MTVFKICTNLLGPLSLPFSDSISNSPCLTQPRLLHHHNIMTPNLLCTSFSKLPSVGDIVDVFWDNYERYFRGTLVKRSSPSSFRFHILYEDSDYQITDLNKRRWHPVQGTFHSTEACCKEEQNVLREDDFCPGDLEEMAAVATFTKKTTQKRKKHVADGRIRKRGRRNSLRSVRGESGSDLTDLVPLGPQSQASVSSVGDGKDSNRKTEMKIEANCTDDSEQQDIKEVNTVSLVPKTHWKKRLIVRYRNNETSTWLMRNVESCSKWRALAHVIHKWNDCVNVSLFHISSSAVVHMNNWILSPFPLCSLV